MRGFASDNNAGVHPEVLAAIAEANSGHAAAYGEDPWTARAEQLFRTHFGRQAASYLVFAGSGYPLFRAAARRMVEADGWTVLAEAGDGAAAMREAARVRPDVVGGP